MPSRPEGWALIRMITAGICNTDLELQRGYYGFTGTPGHEFVGEVVEATTDSLCGKRVVGEINMVCGDCPFCRTGRRHHCENRTVLGIVRHPGAFAEYLTLPEENLHVVPDSLSTDAAVFTEPTAAACRILEQCTIPSDQSVAVLGDGKLGLLIAQVLHGNGLKVHLFGRHKDKLAIAAGAGIETTPGKQMYRWVVDATGSAQGLEQAIAMCEPCGTVIMKSTIHEAVPLNTATAIVNEITLVGSRCGPFPPAIQLLARKAVHTQPMITARMNLREAPEPSRKQPAKAR